MKKFISLLGAGNYAKTKYYWKDKQNFFETHFAQEASFKLICNDFTETDQIIIFVTEKAEKTNWIEKPEGKNYTGLSSILSQLNVSVKSVRIPDGNTEEELWQIFEIIFSNIDNNDELYIDITHSFRSLPMILLVLLNYAKVLKNVQIKSISYGNWEGRDVDNFSPIIDLTPLSELQEWTIAANNFIKYGNAKMIVELTNKEIHPILKETQGKNEAAANLRKFSKQLNEFTNILTTVRGKEMFDYDLNSSIKETLSKVQNSNNLITQLNPILQKIEDKLSEFDNNHIKRLYSAGKWCISHEMYQQAYSFLIEGMITLVCIKNELDKENNDIRSLVTSAAKISAKKIPENEWKEIARKNLELTKKLVHYFKENSELARELNSLLDYRNDFMHGGFRQNSRNAQVLIDKINNSITKVKLFFEES